MQRTSFIASSLIAAFLFAGIPSAHIVQAQGFRVEDLVGIGSIGFDITGPALTPDVVGEWTLVRPGNERTTGTDPNFHFEELNAGVYTFSVSLPEGTTATIDMLLDGKHVKSVNLPQITIPLDGSERYLLKVTLEYTQSGIVSVASNPKGLSFHLKGPNDTEWEGITPKSFPGMPQGQYTAYFDDIDGCRSMPPQSDKLTKDSRITLEVNIVCENLQKIEQQNADRSLEFVTLTIGEHVVTFEDVRTSDWFAPYVSKVAKAGVITGYKDRSGIPSGEFGPGNNVTIAELAKIAHEVAGIEEEKVRVPVANARAKGQWFEFYFASAEQNWWEVWRGTRVDPSRPATRAEVIVTLLRALDVPRVWPNGKAFADVTPKHAYSASLATAALDGLVDAGGNFRPNDPINRAEIAKIIANAIDLYIEDTAEVQGDNY